MGAIGGAGKSRIRRNCGMPSTASPECTHPKREIISPPEFQVWDGRGLQVRTWFCRQCFLKWDETEDLGYVESIEFRVNFQ